MDNSQTGEFYPNTIGFPILITLEDMTDTELGEIVTMALTITRPDHTTFQRNLSPADIVNDKVQYVTQESDIPVGGRYHYSLVLNMTGDRTLPLLGSFEVNNVDVRTDDTHATRMLALIEAALEGRIPAGLEMTIINGQNITRIPVNQLMQLRQSYMAEIRSEENKARVESGLPSRRNSFVRFRPVQPRWFQY